MQSDIQVVVRALAPTQQGVGVFLTDGQKTIAIFVDPFVAGAISMYADGVKAPRPLTHDLMARILDGLGARVQKVVINDLQEDTFFARLHLAREGESGRHLVEIDARPSDSIALAIRQKCPIFVRADVWKRAGDMAWALEEASGTEDGNGPTEPSGDPKGTE